MLRIGICDDEQEMRFTLRYRLERILEARDVQMEVYEFSSGDGLLGWYEKNAGALDLVFLDIEMSGSNGMETAKQLRRTDANLQLVFVTGHPDFVFDGYSVGALGYLMKPPSAEQLESTLARAMAVLHLQSEEVYVCRNGDGVFRVPKGTIRFFSSDKRLVTCVAAARDYTFYAKLDEVANEVGQGFVRIHQRYLVNAAAVERIDKGAVQVGGQALPVSRAYQKEAVAMLTRAMLD